MTSRTASLLLSLSLCVGITVVYLRTPMTPGDPRMVSVPGWCILGALGALFLAAFARKGVAGIGVAFAGLVASLALLFLGNALTPGSFLGILIAIGTVLLASLGYFVSALVAFLRVEFGVKQGDSLNYLSEMLMSYSFFAIAWCVLTIAFSWT